MITNYSFVVCYNAIFFIVASATWISVADMLKSKSTAHLLAYHSELRATILKFASN